VSDRKARGPAAADTANEPHGIAENSSVATPSRSTGPRRRAKILTVAAIRKFRPIPGEFRIIRDAGCQSLYLTIQASGTKSFMMRFRNPTGRAAKIVLGRVNLSNEASGEPIVGMPLTLGQARQLAATIHRQRAMGRDVIAELLAAKRRRRDAVREAVETTRAVADVQAFIENTGAETIAAISVVYFVMVGSAVKIGFTSNITARLKDLKAATADRTAVLAIIPGGRDLEQKFHRVFAAARISNEFFKADVVMKFLGDLGPASICIAGGDNVVWGAFTKESPAGRG
jgi:Arm DNA-binding domain/Meiotically up-regulated gene 113